MSPSVLDSEETTSDSQTELSSEVASYIQEQKTVQKMVFKPGWRFFVALSSMSAITLMVALDATSLGNALPVRNILVDPTSNTD